jgi:hypothetical protein
MDKTMSGYHIYILLEGEYFTNIKNFINLCESAKNKKELEQKYIQELKLFESYHEKSVKKAYSLVNNKNQTYNYIIQFQTITFVMNILDYRKFWNIIKRKLPNLLLKFYKLAF